MTTELAVVGLGYIAKFPTVLTIEHDQENKTFPRQACNVAIHIGSSRSRIMIASNADLHQTRQSCTLFQYILCPISTPLSRSRAAHRGIDLASTARGCSNVRCFVPSLTTSKIPVDWLW